MSDNKPKTDTKTVKPPGGFKERSRRLFEEKKDKEIKSSVLKKALDRIEADTNKDILQLLKDKTKQDKSGEDFYKDLDPSQRRFFNPDGTRKSPEEIEKIIRRDIKLRQGPFEPNLGTTQRLFEAGVDDEKFLAKGGMVKKKKKPTKKNKLAGRLAMRGYGIARN